MDCDKEKILGCHICQGTGCVGLKDYTCVECMTLHAECAWSRGFDIRPFIKKVKDKFVMFCQACEDRLKYGEVHKCLEYNSMDWLDVMASLPKERNNGI